MRFSTRTRYGLRLLVRLAQASPKVVTLRQIAHEEDISVGYLEQIVHRLKPLHILHAARGVGGGYIFVKDPAEISLDEVVTLLEGSLACVPCLEENASCERLSVCPTHLFWLGFEQHIRGYLQKKSLKSLLTM